MSYMIMKSITIMPDKIVYIGCDNNIYPHYDGHFEKELTWQNLRYLINDLVGYCIHPCQPWWQSMLKQLQSMYEWEEIIKNDDMAETAMLYVLSEYNHKVIQSFKMLRDGGHDVQLTLIKAPQK